jgi:hypothetical protein
VKPLGLHKNEELIDVSNNKGEREAEPVKGKKGQYFFCLQLLKL